MQEVFPFYLTGCTIARHGQHIFSQKSTARLASAARFQYASQEDDEGYSKGDIKIDRRKKGEGGGGDASRALQSDRQSREARCRQGEHRCANEVPHFKTSQSGHRL